MKNEITQDEMHAALTRAHELRSLRFFHVLKACTKLLKSYKKIIRSIGAFTIQPNQNVKIICVKLSSILVNTFGINDLSNHSSCPFSLDNLIFISSLRNKHDPSKLPMSITCE